MRGLRIITPPIRRIHALASLGHIFLHLPIGDVLAIQLTRSSQEIDVSAKRNPRLLVRGHFQANAGYYGLVLPPIRLALPTSGSLFIKYVNTRPPPTKYVNPHDLQVIRRLWGGQALALALALALAMALALALALTLGPGSGPGPGPAR